MWGLRIFYVASIRLKQRLIYVFWVAFGGAAAGVAFGALTKVPLLRLKGRKCFTCGTFTSKAGLGSRGHIFSFDSLGGCWRRLLNINIQKVENRFWDSGRPWRRGRSWWDCTSRCPGSAVDQLIGNRVLASVKPGGFCSSILLRSRRAAIRVGGKGESLAATTFSLSV